LHCRVSAEVRLHIGDIDESTDMGFTDDSNSGKMTRIEDGGTGGVMFSLGGAHDSESLQKRQCSVSRDSRLNKARGVPWCLPVSTLSPVELCQNARIKTCITCAGLHY
jgi:hypothetical protein